jgi:hypothetical protein
MVVESAAGLPYTHIRTRVGSHRTRAAGRVAPQAFACAQRERQAVSSAKDDVGRGHGAVVDAKPQADRELEFHRGSAAINGANLTPLDVLDGLLSHARVLQYHLRSCGKGSNHIRWMVSSGQYCSPPRSAC